MKKETKKNSPNRELGRSEIKAVSPNPFKRAVNFKVMFDSMRIVYESVCIVR